MARPVKKSLRVCQCVGQLSSLGLQNLHKNLPLWMQ